MAPTDRDQHSDDLQKRRARAEFEQFFKDNYRELAGFISRRGGILLGREASTDIAEDVMGALYGRLVDSGKDPIDCPRAHVYSCATSSPSKLISVSWAPKALGRSLRRSVAHMLNRKTCSVRRARVETLSGKLGPSMVDNRTI
ncbi:hypothetical protein AGRA3207_007419 [Actinomadura graeca]|uniref:RNA polymerase sigma-70 region 2 domain-containing protein n=1 Tax=Actinomadura graeca TaxID=2750812 RepID=A0ABX8R448_9ACTN|nr:hypothetical protein [Actinomadura graeca]QXJ25855.1 hypothetical protein AGRA3207_007419 [Actinomadura graeca]